VGSLSPWHGMSPGHGCRRRPLGMEDSCEYIKQSQTADRRLSYKLGLSRELTTHCKKSACYEMLHRALDLYEFFRMI
jgi:hypothetical protein